MIRAICLTFVSQCCEESESVQKPLHLLCLSKADASSEDPVIADDVPWPSLPSRHDEQLELVPAARLDS